MRLQQRRRLGHARRPQRQHGLNDDHAHPAVCASAGGGLLTRLARDSWAHTRAWLVGGECERAGTCHVAAEVALAKRQRGGAGTQRAARSTRRAARSSTALHHREARQSGSLRVTTRHSHASQRRRRCPPYRRRWRRAVADSQKRARARGDSSAVQRRPLRARLARAGRKHSSGTIIAAHKSQQQQQLVCRSAGKKRRAGAGTSNISNIMHSRGAAQSAAQASVAGGNHRRELLSLTPYERHRRLLEDYGACCSRRTCAAALRSPAARPPLAPRPPRLHAAKYYNRTLPTAQPAVKTDKARRASMIADRSAAG